MITGDDDVLLDLLGRALRRAPTDVDSADEPPADAVALAKAAWSDSELDAELAALVFDTAMDGMVGAMRNGPAVDAEQRSLVFEGATGRIEVELVSTDGELMGQLIPAAVATVELHAAGGVRTTSSDDLGRFRFDLPTGSVRLRVRRPGGPDLLTPWMSRY